MKRIKHKLKKFILHLVDTRLSFIANTYASKYADDVVARLTSSAYIVSPMETLNELENHIASEKRGAYMRFGDGDVYLATGKNDLFQEGDQSLSKELNEAFAVRGVGIFKSLSIHSVVYGHEPEMFVGNHLVTTDEANKLLRPVYSCFVGYKIYSPVALHFAATYHTALANRFLRFLKRRTVLFIGNEDVPAAIVLQMFGDVKHVATPSRNAYTQIEEISKEAKLALENVTAFGVVVLSMGCSGRALIKRLYSLDKNVFYFDFGSLLDGIIGQNTRTWLKKAEIDYSQLLHGL